MTVLGCAALRSVGGGRRSVRGRWLALVAASLAVAFSTGSARGQGLAWVSRHGRAADVGARPPFPSHVISGWIRKRCLTVDASGNVYVTGFRETGTGTVSLTVKYDAAGVEQWAASADGLGEAIAVDAAGNVYVAGTIGSSFTDTREDYLTIKYNAVGAQQWARRFNGAGNGETSSPPSLWTGQEASTSRAPLPSLGTWTTTLPRSSTPPQERSNGPGESDGPGLTILRAPSASTVPATCTSPAGTASGAPSSTTRQAFSSGPRSSPATAATALPTRSPSMAPQRLRHRRLGEGCATRTTSP